MLFVKLPKNNYLKYDKINQSIIEKCNFMESYKDILNSKSIGLALSGGGSKGFGTCWCAAISGRKTSKPKAISGTSAGMWVLYILGKSLENFSL
jgi:hypothetical protein